MPAIFFLLAPRGYPPLSDSILEDFDRHGDAFNYNNLRKRIAEICNLFQTFRIVTGMPKKMHANEVVINKSLVRSLLTAQFPQWASLPIRRVKSAGTSNAIYLLGVNMCVRLPRVPGAVYAIEREDRWLPKLAPHLPVAIPAPLAMGKPGHGYPWAWAVCRWLPGKSVDFEPIVDTLRAASDLAGFVTALKHIDPTGGPSPKDPIYGRGVPLARRDDVTRNAIADLEALPQLGVDIAEAAAAWKQALRAPDWDKPPVWVHGDLLPGNLLIKDGRLSGVIDFGSLAVADPACDLLPAWTILSGESRQAFRAALSVDDATWDRGRGLALSVGLLALPYYHKTNPRFAAIAHHMINQVLADS